LKDAARADSFISYAPVPANIRAIREKGIAGAVEAMSARITFLRELLTDYNDGRSKGFYCLAVQLLPLDELQAELSRHADALTEANRSQRAAALRRAFTGLAGQKGLTLKLRNQKKEGNR
jgi:hypothetical protein